MRIILFLIFLLPTFVTADNYQCRIIEVLDVAENGKLQPQKDNLPFGRPGEMFVVDGDTGNVIGSQVLINSDWGKPKVLRPGASDDMLLILTVNDTNNHIYSLEISVSKPTMPFIYYSSMWGVNTGVCKKLS